MATMELSAIQAQIAREVLNIEDAELLKKIQRSIKRLCSKAKAEAEREKQRIILIIAAKIFFFIIDKFTY